MNYGGRIMTPERAKAESACKHIPQYIDDPNASTHWMFKGGLTAIGGPPGGKMLNPEWKECWDHALANPAIRKGPRPVEEQALIDARIALLRSKLPEGCADWSGRCKDSHVYNTADGSRCPRDPREVQQEMYYMLGPCPESVMDRPKKMPTWVWVAVGAGAALFLTRRRR